MTISTKRNQQVYGTTYYSGGFFFLRIGYLYGLKIIFALLLSSFNASTMTVASFSMYLCAWECECAGRCHFNLWICHFYGCPHNVCMMENIYYCYPIAPLNFTPKCWLHWQISNWNKTLPNGSFAIHIHQNGVIHALKPLSAVQQYRSISIHLFIIYAHIDL